MQFCIESNCYLNQINIELKLYRKVSATFSIESNPIWFDSPGKGVLDPWTIDVKMVALLDVRKPLVESVLQKSEKL